MRYVSKASIDTARAGLNMFLRGIKWIIKDFVRSVKIELKQRMK